MQPVHGAAAGGVTAMLAAVLVWLTHWPIQPLDPSTALDLAGLTVAGFSWIALREKKGGPSS